MTIDVIQQIDNHSRKNLNKIYKDDNRIMITDALYQSGNRDATVKL